MHYDYHSESGIRRAGLSGRGMGWQSKRIPPAWAERPGRGDPWYEECIGSCNVIEEQLIAILCACSNCIELEHGIIIGQKRQFGPSEQKQRISELNQM